MFNMYYICVCDAGHLIWKARSPRRRVIMTLFVVIIQNLLLSRIKICSKRAISDARNSIIDAFG